MFEYYYDAQGIVAFKYDGAVYYFKKNLMGDIDRIYDANKNLVAEYKYDAWGNHRIYTGTGIDITDNSSYNNSVAKLNPCDRQVHKRRRHKLHTTHRNKRPQSLRILWQ